MVVIQAAPDLQYKPQWLVGEIDFDYELSRQAAEESHGAMRTAASRDFEAEMQWAVDEFVRRMEQRGHIFYADLGAPIIKGPFLPYNYGEKWPTAGVDNGERSRRRESGVEETGGRVCYRIAAPFLVREHILRQVVEREKVSEEKWAALKNSKKEGGIWKPQSKQRTHYPVEVKVGNGNTQ